jgi:hypothetical protein
MHRDHVRTGLGKILDIRIAGRIAFTTSAPMVMLGTKWPSMTSIWIQSAPALSTARTSSPSLAKSAERIDGAMMISCVMALSYMALSYMTAA